MVSVPIGGVRVDLQLNSAAFVRDIAKSTTAMNTGVQKMTGQLNGLQRTVNTVSQSFLGFLSVRALKQVINYTEACVRLAATIKGPLGTAAKEFEDRATALNNSFKLGLAEGFMQTLQEGLKSSGVGMRELAAAGVIAGNLLGFVLTTIVNFFTHEIPEGIKVSINAINTIITAYNDLRHAREQAAMAPSALAPGAAESGLLGQGNFSGGIPLIDTSGIKSSITDWVDVTAAAQAYGGALQTTGEAQRLMNAAASNFHDLAALSNAAWEEVRTPMEKYEETLGRIMFLEKEHAISAQTSARLTAQANTELLSTYIDGVQQATGALAGAFKENKAIQLANAVVNTAAGVVKALGDPKLPFPLDFAVAASIAAAGAAQIATILSAQPGSSKATKTPKGGGSTAKAGASQRSVAGPTQVVTLNIVGDVFGPEHFRKIVAGINGVQRDGTALLQVS
jgi:hypothetical protein